MATTNMMPPSRRKALQERGVTVLTLPVEGGRVSLSALLDVLGQRDITTLLVEGGGRVVGAFFDQGLVRKVHAIIAPIVVGGASAPTPVAGHGVERLAQAWRLQEVTWIPLGADWLITGYVEEKESL